MRLNRHRVFSLLTGAAAGMLLASAAPATTIYNDGLISSINGPSEDILVEDGIGGPTTVFVGPGADIAANEDVDNMQSILVTENSVVVMSNGATADSAVAKDSAAFFLSGGAIGGSLVVTHTANAAMVAGELDDISADGDATVQVIDGTGDDIFVAGNALVEMTGGFFDNPNVDGGVFDFSGGRVDDFLGEGDGVVFLRGDAHVDDDVFFGGLTFEMSGGEIDDELFIEDTTVATITGGVIGDDLNVVDNSVVDVFDVQLDDSVDVGNAGVVNIFDGNIEGGVEAAGADAVANIFGGTVAEVVLSNLGTVTIADGEFGEGIASTLGGTLVMDGGTLEAFDGPEVAAALNGVTTVNGATATEFDVSAQSGGLAVINDFDATDASVAALAGEVDLQGGEADSLSIFGELSAEITLAGGSFASIDASLETGAELTIIGSSVTYNGIPLSELNDTFGPGAYDEATGEIFLIAGELAGVLRDGSPFSLTFARQFFPLEEVARVFVVPEPSALGLLLIAAFGGLRMRRR